MGFAFTGVLSAVSVLVADVGIVVHVLTDSLFSADAIVVAVSSCRSWDAAVTDAIVLPAAVAAKFAAVVVVLVAPAEAPSAAAAIAVAAVASLVAAAGPHWRWFWWWWWSLRLLRA